MVDRKSRHHRLILDFVKPVVDNFMVNDSLKSFHFFYEGDRLELRLEMDDEISRDEVRNAMNMHLHKVADLVEITRCDAVDYYPEIGDHQFGIDGWEIAKRVFEYGSRLAIAFLDPKSRKGKLLREGKLIHCMLNSLNYDTSGEKIFHIAQAIEREVVILSQEQKMKPEEVDIEKAKQRVKDNLAKLKIYMENS
jgi:hypothetical protein